MLLSFNNCHFIANNNIIYDRYGAIIATASYPQIAAQIAFILNEHFAADAQKTIEMRPNITIINGPPTSQETYKPSAIGSLIYCGPVRPDGPQPNDYPPSYNRGKNEKLS